MTLDEDDDTHGADRRRSPIRWIAAGVGVLVLVLVVVLARVPAGSRTADSPLLGELVPPLQGETIDGDSFDIDDLRGRWVLVNFFATWCTPCRIEHPELIEFQEAHPDDVQIVGVIFDDSVDAVREFREEEGGDWPMVIDDAGIAVSFGVTGVPESYLVAPDGTVVTKLVGGVRAVDLEQLLAELTTPPPAPGDTTQ